MSIFMSKHATVSLLLVAFTAIILGVDASCTPGIVTCCLSADESLRQLIVNDVDITSSVQNASAFATSSVAKVVSFVEPSTTAVIAVKGYWVSAVVHPAFAIKCTCTRAASPWNNLASVYGTGWRNVLATSSGDTFPPNWYSVSYNGATNASAKSTGTPFALNTNVCGTVNSADKLRAQITGSYFTFRRMVNQTVPCGTNSPTSPPTDPITLAPTTKRPTAMPTVSPTVPATNAPSAAPTCARPSYVDVVWVMDGSSSMQESVDGLPGTKFQALREFVLNFARNTPLSPSATRMGYLEYAGEFIKSGVYMGYKTILGSLNVTDQAAVTLPMFLSNVTALQAEGGTTHTSAAFDYVRQYMFTPENLRPGSHRIVILASDGYPTTRGGVQTLDQVVAAEAAIQQMKDEDGVIFVFLRIGDDYPATFFRDQADYIYNTSFPTLNDLLKEDFLCFQLTDTPTTSPETSSPSGEPTSSPTNNPTSSAPSTSPSRVPTSSKPSANPSTSPTTSKPSATPSTAPTTSIPSAIPSTAPSTSKPTANPSVAPSTSKPTTVPSTAPSTSKPSATPSVAPSTSKPTSIPSTSPTSSKPTAVPSANPSLQPTNMPTTLAPSTLAPTTLRPTTLAPTTLTPTTLAPSTLAPTTLAPTTLRPTTLAPTTLTPTTLAPTTPAPTTLAPTTLAPTTLAPTTLAPTTLRPTTLAPTTLTPTTLAPTTLAPTTLAPTTLAPTTLTPTTLAPTTLAPTTLAPTTLRPTTLAPTTLAPTTLAPTTLAPTTLRPTTLAPTTLRPTTLAPTTLAPTTLRPTTLAPTTLAPTTLRPTTLAPTTKAPTFSPGTACTQSTGWVMASTNSYCWSQPPYNVSRWGWTNGPFNNTAQTIPFQVWIGAGNCDTTSGVAGGSGALTIDSNGRATISYQFSAPSGWSLVGSVMAYIGTKAVDKTNPGGMPITVSCSDHVVTDPNPVPNNFYFYIHFPAGYGPC